ncbi:MAG: potassium transporter [Gammaproteobacteria bacterium]|nr:potassium transporter [Gammaproteobacteria bacterium]
MQYQSIQRIFGLLLIVFSSGMMPPLIVSWLHSDGELLSFAYATLITISIGLLLWLPVRKKTEELRLRDGFIVVVLFWTLLGLFGAMPFFLSPAVSLSFTDAAFESFSGLTTTGANVIVGLDSLPESLLFYRQWLQWVGGMGIIVLAVAILPMLGVGGMQLYRAETPGPVKDSKLTPRIAETAKALWYIYLGLTIACMLAYWLAGMSFFDAICHAFSTVSIGGFSTHDASIGYFNSHAIEMVCVVFMLLSGMNFGLHFLAARKLSLKPFLQDAEIKAYLIILILTTIIAVSYLFIARVDKDFSTAFWNGIFQAISIGTTTGFTTANYYEWPGFLPVILIFVSIIGGCSGSTGGGIKVVRFLLLLKQGIRELKRLVHPRAQLNIKMGHMHLDERIIEAVWGFFAAYVAVFCGMLLLLMLAGMDQITAFSAVAACLNNLGPGLGEVGKNYAGLNDFAKWLLCAGMLLGRLEIFTLLVLFTPDFWRD